MKFPSLAELANRFLVFRKRKGWWERRLFDAN